MSDASDSVVRLGDLDETRTPAQIVADLDPYGEIMAGRRNAQLAQQAGLLVQVPMLGVADTIEVLKRQFQFPNIIVLVDALTGTIKIPAFQFIRNSQGKLVVNPDVQKVHSVKSGNGTMSAINNDWDLLDWWFNKTMVFDASAQPAETPFKPISLLGDNAKLRQLIKWIKDWAREDEGGW